MWLFQEVTEYNGILNYKSDLSFELVSTNMKQSRPR